MMKKTGKKEELYQRIYANTLNFLGYQSRSRKEIEDKIERTTLKIKSLTHAEKEEIQTQILQELDELNLIDDEKFAATYVQQRINSPKPTSKISMQQFLYKKGIDKAIVQEALATVSQESEIEAVSKIADKKMRTLGKLTPSLAKQKLTTYLFGKGFSRDVIYSVVDTKFKVQ